MRNLLLCFVLIIILNYTSTERIVLRSRQDQRLYQFFPLKCTYLVFNVKANNDVHVIFTDTYSHSGSYYEIVIGGWGNTKSVMRKDSEFEAVAYNERLLRGNVFQRFWVSMNDTEGSVAVGNFNENAFMYYKDPNYASKSYFGFSTGFGSAGEWFFDDAYLTCDLMKCSK